MPQSVYGLDIAKKVFQIHSVDANTGAPIRLKLSRDELLPYFEQADSSIVAMEACGSAYFWAEQLSLQGHDARLLPPLYVWPFRKTNKNDASDAHAIWEAAQRPEMRFVSIRSKEHRAVLATHKVRKQLVEHRAAYVNQLHGIFAEFGVALPRNWAGMLSIARAILDSDAALSFPPMLCTTLKAAIKAIDDLTVQINSLTSVLERWQQSSEECRRIGEVPGVGVVTATAFIATIGDPHAYRSAKSLTAFLGLTPRHVGTGGVNVMRHIPKRSGSYLRTLLTNGASVAITRNLVRRPTVDWVEKLLERRPRKVANVALAAKNARTMWSMLVHGSEFSEEGAPRAKRA